MVFYSFFACYSFKISLMLPVVPVKIKTLIKLYWLL